MVFWVRILNWIMGRYRIPRRLIRDEVVGLPLPPHRVVIFIPQSQNQDPSVEIVPVPKSESPPPGHTRLESTSGYILLPPSTHPGDFVSKYDSWEFLIIQETADLNYRAAIRKYEEGDETMAIIYTNYAIRMGKRGNEIIDFKRQCVKVLDSPALQHERWLKRRDKYYGRR